MFSIRACPPRPPGGDTPGLLRPLGFLLLFLLLILSSCSNTSVADGEGSGSETVLGKVTKQDGQPARNAEVTLKLVSIGISGGSIEQEFSTTTNDEGGYKLAGISPGTYILEADHASGGILRSRLEVIENGENTVDLQISPRVSLFGRILGPENLTVQVPGTSISYTIASDGFFALDDVSQGTLELILVKDSIVNYVPLVIDSDRDTVYIQDISFTREASGQSQVFHLYETSLASFSILPESYEGSAGPEWYAGKDFTGTVYFESAGDDLIDAGITAPKILIALFPTDDDDPDSTEQVFIDRLERLGIRSVTVWEEFLTLSDTAGVDLIVITSGLNDTLINIPIAEMAIPVWCGETGYYPDLFYVDDLHDSTWGRAQGDADINVVRPSHPIAGAFSGMVTVSDSPIGFPFGIPGPGADVIASHPTEPEKALLFAFETGNLLIDGTPAAARRVGMFMSSQDAFSWNSNAWELFDHSIMWLTGRM